MVRQRQEAGVYSAHSKYVCLVAVLVHLTLFGTGANAQQLPSNFQSEVLIGNGLRTPTAIDFLPDGTMLISEFGGVVKMVPPGGNEVNATPVLTLTNIHLQGERGLVGILVDPNFNSNHFFYVFYTANIPARDRVSRFILNGGTANQNSETIIWQSTSDSNPDHHGGDMAFGIDGKLYITTGDNTNPPNAQQLSNDHGKILRVNSDGTIPTDNPFYDGAGPNADTIWALGLRNPYRFSIDPVSGRMYIGDVGNFFS